MSVVVDAGPSSPSSTVTTRTMPVVCTRSARPLVVPITVLAEVCHIVERKMGPQGDAEFLESLDDGAVGLAPVTFDRLPRNRGHPGNP